MPPTPLTLTDLNRCYAACDIAARGPVTRVGKAPGLWSGIYAAYQEVEYEVVEWLAKSPADAKPKSLTVLHPVVANARTADAQTPALDAAWIRKGAQLIVFVVKKDKQNFAIDEDFGVISYDAGAWGTVAGLFHAGAKK